MIIVDREFCCMLGFILSVWTHWVSESFKYGPAVISRLRISERSECRRANYRGANYHNQLKCVSLKSFGWTPLIWDTFGAFGNRFYLQHLWELSWLELHSAPVSLDQLVFNRLGRMMNLRTSTDSWSIGKWHIEVLLNVTFAKCHVRYLIKR